MTQKGPGPPKVYYPVVAMLDDDKIYTPSMIADFAIRKNYLDKTQEERLLIRRRIRISLARFASNNHFPKRGDKLINLPGQVFIPGYFGRRWKEHYCGEDFLKQFQAGGKIGETAKPKADKTPSPPESSLALDQDGSAVTHPKPL